MVGDVIHHVLWPRCLQGCYENESRFLTPLFWGCHVTIGLAFQGPGSYSGWWHRAGFQPSGGGQWDLMAPILLFYS